MIECTDKKLLKRSRQKGIRRFFVFLIIISLSSFLYFKLVTEKQLYIICSDYAKTYAIESVNDSLIKSVENKTFYSDLITVEKNNDGDIVMLNSNSVKINDLSRNIVSKVEKNLKEKLSNGIPVPLMAFTGIKIISGYGRKINFKTLTVSNVTCEFDSDFTSVGINQTLHSIFVNVICEVKTEFPLNNRTEKFSSEILIGESVLVGKVPEIYLNGKIFS